MLDLSSAVELLDFESQEVDAIDEIRLRTWARQNYRDETERDPSWHPVILDEMERRDRELFESNF